MPRHHDRYESCISVVFSLFVRPFSCYLRIPRAIRKRRSFFHYSILVRSIRTLFDMCRANDVCLFKCDEYNGHLHYRGHLSLKREKEKNSCFVQIESNESYALKIFDEKFSKTFREEFFFSSYWQSRKSCFDSYWQLTRNFLRIDNDCVSR